MHRGQAFCDHTSIIAQIKELYDKIIFYPEVIEKNKISNLLDQISVLESYPKSATHRDLNPNNIFFTDNDVKFIDFENAGQDDLFFDIASVITFYQYSKDAEKKFLKLYFGRELLKDEQAHLKLMKKTVSLFYGLTLMSKLPHFRKIVDAPVPNLQEILKKVSDGSLSLEKEENMMLLSLSFLLNAIDIN
jgi:thiamine kinase-like enzyme